MRDKLDELIDKWQDVFDCAEDNLEKNLVSEFLDDLRRFA